MTFYLIAFLWINGAWVQGDPELGWKPVPYTTESACLQQKYRDEALHRNLMDASPVMPRVVFRCVPEQAS